MVIAESFARIFRQNMFNCGMMAVELPKKVIDHLFENFSTKNTTVITAIEQQVFHIKADSLAEEIPFSLPDFDLALVTAGGWLEFADSKY
jgi:3-isopropylmalate/(R)-2-methylmalate dehydratase small subunit